MANEEHLRILRKGVDRWNQWREENSDVKPDFVNADFTLAELSGANFSGGEFALANLTLADLSGANLSNARLALADLTGADLSHTNLTLADFSNATLNSTDFRFASLISTSLNRTQALKAHFQGANLTGACIEDWNINSETELDSLTCEYIFLKTEQQERRPSDRNKIFAPGDFARLVQKSLETVDLIFSNGIDWKAFALSLEDLRVEYEGQDLSIGAIENKNDAFVIRLNVPPDADKGAIERQAKDFYETRLAVLEAQYEAKLEAKGEVLASYRDQVEYERKRSTRLEGVVEKMAEQSPSSKTYNNHIYGNPANFANELQDNARQQANQHIYTAEQRQTLAEAAADIQQLLEQLSQTYPTTTQSEKLAVATKAAEAIEQNPALKSRVIGALKAGGTEALKELIDHPLVTILLAALEGWQKPE